MNAPNPPLAIPALFTFDNTYARNLVGFYARCQPTPAPRPQLLILNSLLAEELEVDAQALSSPFGVDVLVGNRLAEGADPIAQAYAGHQFGSFSPQLGDGRALLLGELIDRHGQRRDVAFKGSGRTPFSRNGDGKCALGPALREYLMGEAMAALGIPTTRVLSVVATGAEVFRERPLPGAVLTRIAASHLRVGTFEFFAAHRGPEAVRQLADYALLRHDPQLVDHPQPYLALLEAVAERQAALVARWLGVGFIHGVMNTDNMAISGETIDYGPCAFMEAYDPATAFSSIDRHGRYAYGRQADIAQWNLARLAETLLPLLGDDEEQAVERASAVVNDFPQRHGAHWLAVFRAKLGLDDSGDALSDRVLIQDFLDLLDTRQRDFTLAFRALTDIAAGQPAPSAAQFGEADDGAAAWHRQWQARQPRRCPALLAAMEQANPRVIPRNHRVEEALEAAVERNDLSPFRRLLAVVSTPYQLRAEDLHYADPAPAEVTAAYRTFCGT